MAVLPGSVRAYDKKAIHADVRVMPMPIDTGLGFTMAEIKGIELNEDVKSVFTDITRRLFAQEPPRCGLGFSKDALQTLAKYGDDDHIDAGFDAACFERPEPGLPPSDPCFAGIYTADGRVYFVVYGGAAESTREQWCEVLRQNTERVRWDRWASREVRSANTRLCSRPPAQETKTRLPRCCETSLTRETKTRLPRCENVARAGNVAAARAHAGNVAAARALAEDSHRRRRMSRKRLRRRAAIRTHVRAHRLHLPAFRRTRRDGVVRRHGHQVGVCGSRASRAEIPRVARRDATAGGVLALETSHKNSELVWLRGPTSSKGWTSSDVGLLSRSCNAVPRVLCSRGVLKQVHPSTLQKTFLKCVLRVDWNE